MFVVVAAAASVPSWAKYRHSLDTKHKRWERQFIWTCKFNGPCRATQPARQSFPGATLSVRSSIIDGQVSGQLARPTIQQLLATKRTNSRAPD